jgi:hypothetical protein
MGSVGFIRGFKRARCGKPRAVPPPRPEGKRKRLMVYRAVQDEKA